MATIIYNNLIPLKGYTAVTLWPLVFARHELSARIVRHEAVHGFQQKEMLAVGGFIAAVLWAAGCGWWSLLVLPLFLWWYGLEYLVRLFICRNHDDAYYNISMEQEAYLNEQDASYLANRRPFAWIKYITRRTYKR